MRFLFLAVHAPDRAPGQRFRFEQYLGALRERGIEVDFSWVLDAKRASLLYSPGNVPRKALLAARSAMERVAQIPSLRRYDLVFVQREALFVGGPFFERAARASGATLVYDFDDAIWVNDASPFNRRFNWLKNTAKIPRLIAMSNLVIAGNPYLAEYARTHNANVTVVPTTIDTDSYLPRAVRPKGPVCIGWSGSFSTILHFKTVLPVLRRVHARYGDRVRFRVIGDGTYRNEELGIVGLPWTAATEIEDLQDIDIGVMPLPDDEWARGKCGLKGLQYMALGIPTLMSPVGVNTEIIQDGKNGYLPRSADEWVSMLSTLVEDAELRAVVGAAGRRRVEESFSVNAWRDRYCDLLTAVARR